jgi:hypothetical protein
MMMMLLMLLLLSLLLSESYYAGVTMDGGDAWAQEVESSFCKLLVGNCLVRLDPELKCPFVLRNIHKIQSAVVVSNKQSTSHTSVDRMVL